MQAERRQRAASSVRVTFTRFFIAIPVIGYEIKELLAPLRSVMMRRRRIRGRRQHAAAAEEAESRCQHQQLCQNFFHVFLLLMCMRKQQTLTPIPSAGTLKPTDGLPKQSIVRQRCWIFSAAVRHGWKKTGGGGGGGAGTTICGGGSGCGAGRITAGPGPGGGGG